MSRLRSFAAVAPLFAAFALAPALSRADEPAAPAPAADRAEPPGDDVARVKLACIDDHASVQRARRGGKLLEARAGALRCAQPSCPSVLQSECERLLADLDRAIPSLVVEVRGDDLVALTIDGAAQANLERPIALDPGPHAVRATTTRSGVLAERVVLVAGEGTRRVELVSRALALAAPDRASAATAPSARDGREGARTRWLPLSLGAVSAVALGSFAFFAVEGVKREAAMEASCAPACDPARVDAMQRDYLVADVALGVGLVAAGAAITTWIVGK